MTRFAGSSVAALLVLILILAFSLFLPAAMLGRTSSCLYCGKKWYQGRNPHCWSCRAP